MTARMTGTRSAASNTGYQSAANNTGNRSAAGNTGDYSAASVEGVGSIALVTGFRSRAKACKGSGFVLVEHKDDGSIKKIHTAIAGKKGIRPDVYYALEGGKIVGAQND